MMDRKEDDESDTSGGALPGTDRCAMRLEVSYELTGPVLEWRALVVPRGLTGFDRGSLIPSCPTGTSSAWRRTSPSALSEEDSP